MGMVRICLVMEDMEIPRDNATFSTGRFGDALDLSSGGTFVVPESVSRGILGDQARTVSLWVKTPTVRGYHVSLLRWGILTPKVIYGK